MEPIRDAGGAVLAVGDRVIVELEVVSLMPGLQGFQVLLGSLAPQAEWFDRQFYRCNSAEVVKLPPRPEVAESEPVGTAVRAE